MQTKSWVNFDNHGAATNSWVLILFDNRLIIFAAPVKWTSYFTGQADSRRHPLTVCVWATFAPSFETGMHMHNLPKLKRELVLITLCNKID